MKRFATLVFLLFLLTVTAVAQPKRDFRGAWIQCVNGQFQALGRDRMQQTLSQQLDELQRDGVNAIFFQVRAECDALYPSAIEPWSRFLTGQQGLAPVPFWDPLQWMITECHRRGMELHAWVNPYRAKTKTTHALAPTHIAMQHPELCFSYDDLGILNPAYKESSDYICRVVDDIVSRYDIDGIHMDDYFYPYPVAGQLIPDAALYQQAPRGCKTIADWRRDNVDRFIEQVSHVIKQRKPWVKFGISPFGIYRNQAQDPQGSATRGLSNYDDLYADVLLWAERGWIDYLVPQIYWQIGHPTADYATLIQWWNDHCTHRPLFIGEDVERTVKYPDPQNPQSHQLAAKHRLHQQLPRVEGTVLWYAKAVADNVGNYGSVLRTDYWRYPALQPLMPFIDHKAPRKPRKARVVWTSDGPVLFWRAPKGKQWGDQPMRYVVYRFRADERQDLTDPSHIVTITALPTLPAKPVASAAQPASAASAASASSSSEPFSLVLPYAGGLTRYVYIVTTLDRTGNESKPARVKVSL